MNRDDWCPECRQGKCDNCTREALNPVTDEMGPCRCPKPRHRARFSVEGSTGVEERS